MYGKCFNHFAQDAWELFQSTGIESIIAYDCPRVFLLMVTILGRLITRTRVGIWTWFKRSDRVWMDGSIVMLIGMIMVSHLTLFLCAKKHFLRVINIMLTGIKKYITRKRLLVMDKKEINTKVLLEQLNHIKVLQCYTYVSW